MVKYRVVKYETDVSLHYQIEERIWDSFFFFFPSWVVLRDNKGFEKRYTNEEHAIQEMHRLYGEKNVKKTIISKI